MERPDLEALCRLLPAKPEVMPGAAYAGFACLPQLACCLPDDLQAGKQGRRVRV